MSYELQQYDDLNNILASYRVVILKFYMEGCGPCVNLKRDLDNFQMTYPAFSPQQLQSKGVLIVNINYQYFPNYVAHFNVESFPSVFIKTPQGMFKLDNNAYMILSTAVQS